ncbi:MAG: hypothetical protein EA398_01725 [Deltaproteobacteria bacterium]|nr:MAG: hypothetical protein EA398_01725 [Deltaproteobacteria bacterium]
MNRHRPHRVRPALRTLGTLTAAGALLLAACGDDPAATDSTTGPSPSPPGASDVPVSSGEDVPTAACDEESHEAFFVEAVWPTLGTTCFACHGGSSIGALGSDLRLVEVRTAVDHTTNYATARDIALREQDGRSLLLRKPLGELDHGGGPLLREEDEAFAALVAFVERVSAGTCDAPDGHTAAPAGLASLRWNDEAVEVRLGRVTPIAVQALDADGNTLRMPDGLRVTVADESIARVEGTSRLRGLQEGTTTVTARVGDLSSPALPVTVRPNPDFGTAALRVHPEQLVLAPGDTRVLSATLRERTGDRIPGAQPLWRSAHPDVATVDEHGLLTAVAPGTAEIRAEFEGATSPPLTVRVTDAATALDVRWTLPTSDASAATHHLLAADVRTWPVDNPRSFGTPVVAERAVLLVDGAEHGPLEASIDGVRGQIDLSTLDVDSAELRIRVEHGGETVVSPPRVLSRVTAAEDETWRTLGGENPPQWRSLYGVEARLFALDGHLHLLANRCGRECSLLLHQFDLSNPGGEWRGVQYRQRVQLDWDGQPPEREEESSRVNLPRFAGWGWPSADAREPHVMPGTPERLIVWSNEDARTRFNLEGEPERFWYDCHVARWSDSAGLDGNGGWRLLSRENPAFLDELRRDTMPEERGDQRHPAGVDMDRTEDCNTPHLALVDGAPTVAYVATPVPDNVWRLRVRRWTGSEWENAGPVLDLPPMARIHDMIADGEGRLIAIVDTPQQEAELLQLSGGAWRPIGFEGPARAVRETAGGHLVVGAVVEGDLTVHVREGDRWRPLGARLNRSAWQDAHEVDLVVTGDRIAVVWTEGPLEGTRMVWAAVWLEDAWDVVGGAPVEMDPDVRAIDVRGVIDADGHLSVTWAQPNTRDEDLQGGVRSWFRHVRRTASPLF